MNYSFMKLRLIHHPRWRIVIDTLLSCEVIVNYIESLRRIIRIQLDAFVFTFIECIEIPKCMKSSIYRPQ